jgi:hypothetical protein
MEPFYGGKNLKNNEVPMVIVGQMIMNTCKVMIHLVKIFNNSGNGVIFEVKIKSGEISIENKNTKKKHKKKLKGKWRPCVNMNTVGCKIEVLK